MIWCIGGVFTCGLGVGAYIVRGVVLVLYPKKKENEDVDIRRVGELETVN